MKVDRPQPSFPVQFELFVSQDSEIGLPLDKKKNCGALYTNMSAVAARKAALAAKLAAESANPSPTSTPIATPARSASPEPPVQEVDTEAPQASSSRATTPSKRTPKKSTPRRAGRDTAKKDAKTEKVAEQRYYQEEVSIGDKRNKGDKRSKRVYEEVVERRNSPVVPVGEQDDGSQSQSEDDEEDLDFSALELLQTITNGRPKKKRRISTSVWMHPIEISHLADRICSVITEMSLERIRTSS